MGRILERGLERGGRRMITVKAEIKITNESKEIILDSSQTVSALFQILEILRDCKDVVIKIKEETPIEVSCNGADYSSRNVEKSEYKHLDNFNKWL
jgi:acetolactate synthase regulatory subunit